jgi:hypothetical protein
MIRRKKLLWGGFPACQNQKIAFDVYFSTISSVVSEPSSPPLPPLLLVILNVSAVSSVIIQIAFGVEFSANLNLIIKIILDLTGFYQSF